MDRILFGDNQFFGVNYASEEKARLQTIRFQTIESIIKVLDTAYDAGIRVCASGMITVVAPASADEK